VGRNKDITDMRKFIHSNFIFELVRNRIFKNNFTLAKFTPKRVRMADDGSRED
jgi:hypothetical protein